MVKRKKGSRSFVGVMSMRASNFPAFTLSDIFFKGAGATIFKVHIPDDD